MTSQGAESKKQAENKQATDEGEEKEEENGEKEEEEEEEEVGKRKKDKNSPDNEEKQANSTVSEEPLIPTPASTAKEKGKGNTTAKANATRASTGDDRLVNEEKRPTEQNTVSTQEPNNDRAEMQIPQSSTVSPKNRSEGKGDWPFTVHTGEHIFFFQTHLKPVKQRGVKNKNLFDQFTSLSLFKPASLQGKTFPKQGAVNYQHL